LATVRTRAIVRAMSAIDLRGNQPIPILTGPNVPVHVVVRMVAELGAPEVAATTPLTPAELQTVAEYYRDHRDFIDQLLAEEAAVATGFQQRLDEDREAPALLRRVRGERTVGLDELRRRKV
jgi:hypothetical protein